MLAFFNRPIISKKKMPDPTKNFFQNYADHIYWIYMQDQVLAQCLAGDESKAALMDANDLLDSRHLLMFDALRDAHDYTDEVMGVTVIPVLSALLALVAAAKAIEEGVQALVIIDSGTQTNDLQDHVERSLNFFMAAGLFLVASLGFLVKSLISLISRPIATLVSGWEPQTVDRFYPEIRS